MRRRLLGLGPSNRVSRYFGGLGMSNQEQQGISQDLVQEVRKQTIQQLAKWLIGALVVLLVVAATGWWFFLEPKLKAYIADAAGGVPLGTVLVSTVPCSELGEGWSSFREGKGRFLVGAGPDEQAAYSTWQRQLPTGGFEPVPLSTYEVLFAGGEEHHTLSIAQMPKHRHEFVGNGTTTGGYGPKGHDVSFGDTLSYGTYTPSGTITDNGSDQPANNLPPFVAVNFCKKGGLAS